MLSYLYMKVTICEPKGYCTGVNRAINIAINAKNEHKDLSVYVLGMLVHNNEVINMLTKKGIITIEKSEVENIPDESVVIFTAHGHETYLDEIAERKHFIVYDAICPKVHSNLTLIKNYVNERHQAVYIGQKGHPETEAALSLDKNVILYDLKNGLTQPLIDKSPLVINQTTLSILDLRNIHYEILNKYKNANIRDEICNTTRMRQQGLTQLPKDTDLILIVGDSKSSNTNRLFEIATKYNQNIECYMISNLEALDKNVIQNKNHIVIASGASTPNETIDMIANYLRKF